MERIFHRQPNATEELFWRDLAYPILRLTPGTKDYQLRIAAKRVTQGDVVALPSETVYTFCTDGSQVEAVGKLSLIKGGRKSDQRPAVIFASPERILDKIDFKLLRLINPTLIPAGVVEFFRKSHGGLIVPCKSDAFPKWLTLDLKHEGIEFPTVLIIGNMSYRPWRIFEQEISRFPKVIPVGTSANDVGGLPLKEKEMRHHPRFRKPHLIERLIARFRDSGAENRPYLAMRIRDHHVESRPLLASYTMVSLITNEVLRYGDVLPETHPAVYEAWDAIFGGRLNYRTKLGLQVPV